MRLLFRMKHESKNYSPCIRRDHVPFPGHPRLSRIRRRFRNDMETSTWRYFPRKPYRPNRRKRMRSSLYSRQQLLLANRNTEDTAISKRAFNFSVVFFSQYLIA